MVVELPERQAAHSATDAAQVKVFKALSDPVRLQILRYLKQAGRGVTCSEIDEAMDISKSAGSYHFRVLREAGLTITEKKSREKYVSIDLEALERYVTGFAGRL